MKYKVYVQKTVFGEIEVEAENEYDAECQAEDAFGDDDEFEWNEYSEDWEVVRTEKEEQND